MTKKSNDGGPAFPRSWTEGSNGEYWNASTDGMSLRDWFAGQAVAGFLACERHVAIASGSGHPLGKTVAGWAYEVADAMLAARAPQPPSKP